jgi:hypothetical protein
MTDASKALKRARDARYRAKHRKLCALRSKAWRVLGKGAVSVTKYDPVPRRWLEVV